MIGSCVWTAMLASMTGNPFVKFCWQSLRKKKSSRVFWFKEAYSHPPRGDAQCRGEKADDFTRGKTASDKAQESRPTVPGMMPSFRDRPYLEKTGGVAKIGANSLHKCCPAYARNMTVERFDRIC